MRASTTIEAKKEKEKEEKKKKFDHIARLVFANFETSLSKSEIRYRFEKKKKEKKREKRDCRFIGEKKREREITLYPRHYLRAKKKRTRVVPFDELHNGRPHHDDYPRYLMRFFLLLSPPLLPSPPIKQFIFATPKLVAFISVPPPPRFAPSIPVYRGWKSVRAK